VTGINPRPRPRRWSDGTTSSTNPSTVSKDTTSGILYLAAFSQSGICFFLLDDPPNDAENSGSLSWQTGW
jgi:hypothetical protein